MRFRFLPDSRTKSGHIKLPMMVSASTVNVGFAADVEALAFSIASTFAALMSVINESSLSLALHWLFNARFSHLFAMIDGSLIGWPNLHALLWAATQQVDRDKLAAFAQLTFISR